MDWQQKLWQRGFEALVPARGSGRRVRASERSTHTLALAAVMLGSIGGAALLGAAVMALVTPMSGRELRRILAHALAAVEDEEDFRRDYDSGEYVIEGGELAEHHASRYESAAQPTNEDDTRPFVDGRSR